MSILSSILSVLVMLAKELLPTLIDEWKKPREIRYIGEDNAVDAALDAEITAGAIAYAEEQEAIDAEESNPNNPT